MDSVNDVCCLGYVVYEEVGRGGVWLSVEYDGMKDSKRLYILLVRDKPTMRYGVVTVGTWGSAAVGHWLQANLRRTGRIYLDVGCCTSSLQSCDNLS